MLIFSTFSMSAQTYYDYYGGVYYQPNDDGLTAAIASPNGDGYYQGVITIPSTITNEDTGVTYTVTSILGRAFENSPELTKVIIPATIHEIGAWAFHNCTKLKYVELKGGVDFIGNDVFSGCEIHTLVLGPQVTSIKRLKIDPTVIVSEAIVPPTCDEITFTQYDAELTVPDEGYNDYLTADYWKNFFTVESLTLVDQNVTLFVGDTYTLTANVTSHNLKDPVITWTSSDESIVTVNNNGVITATGVGECDITATCRGVSATCHITVMPVLPQSITLNSENESVFIGETLQLTATVLPENTTNKVVKWSSSDENIATVNQNGLVTTVNLGECDIIASCQGLDATCHITVKPILPTAITLSSDSAVLLIGETVRLRATVMPENTTDKTVTWTSSDTSIATVNQNGSVTAIGVGECDITATCQGVSATCHIIVRPILPQSITLSSESESIYIGATVQLTATVLPENTTNKTVTWTSSDESIATVDENGLVTAVAVGECDVTATCQGVSATCHITVKPILPQSITLSSESESIYIGATVQLTATVMPENTTDKTITWASKNENIATVDENGLVTAVALGECDITATCQGLSATCHITVKPILPQSITLNSESESLHIGETVQLTATVLPENTTNKTVTWASKNENIATVDENGLVTAVALGECDITATCQGVSATCHITVKPVLPESIILSSEYESIFIGETLQLTATVLPENTTDKTVTWASSDETIATVDQNGLVTTVDLGECDITATCQGVSATCQIEVEPLLGGTVIISTDSAMVKEGDSIQLSVNIQPVNIAGGNVTWISTNENIAQVDESGLVMTKTAGECDIIATYFNVYGTAHITVIDPADISITIDMPQFTACLSNVATIDVTTYPIPTELKATSSDTTVAVVRVEDNIVKIQGLDIGYADIVIGSQDGISLSDTCQVSIYTKIGDADGNGNTSVGDITALIDHLLSGKPYDYLTDINGDGVIAIDDVAYLVDILLDATNIGQLVAPQSIELEVNEVQIPVGSNYTLNATVLPAEVYNSTIIWTSSNKAVATVDKNGVITAIGTGSCDIIANCYNVESTCHVTVTEVKPDSVTLDITNSIMHVGETLVLTATVHPSNVSNPRITWTTSNSAIATVRSGKVTAVALGTCDIIATCQDKQAVCHIEVTEVTADSVTLNIVNGRLKVGETLKLTATVYPSNVADPTITWSSTKPAVATVKNGTVAAVAKGECDIIATCQDKQAVCHIEVYEVTPESVTLNITSGRLQVGETLTLTATVLPSNVTNPTVTWKSTKTSVATVKNGKVTAVAVGECDIIATCQGVSATCHIEVYQASVESIAIDHESANLAVGSTLTLTASIYPENVPNAVISWSSSNTSVATVVNGVVTAKTAGQCDIIATCQGVSATCHITVIDANTDGIFTVNGVSFEMVAVEGGTFKMGALNTSPDTSTSCKPQHDVTVDGFSIGKTEVTQELWLAVMGTNPSLNKGDLQRPVEYITWNDCQTFLSKLNEMTGMNFRLPTEAEWEYAARGGKYSHGYKYAGGDKIDEVAWVSFVSGGTSHPVAQLKPNELGLYDMSGNVREWVQDWFSAYTSAPQVNPTGPATGSLKVFRGGSYETTYKECFVTYRYMREVTFRQSYLGLRLAL